MARTAYCAAGPAGSERTAKTPAAPPSAVTDAFIRVKTLWVSSLVLLGCVGIAVWTVKGPSRDAVVLSATAQTAAPVLPWGGSSPFTVPGAVPAGQPVSPAAAATAPLLAAREGPSAPAGPGNAGSTLAVLPAGAASVWVVPTSSWPVDARSPNEVAPRSDMRYRAGTPPRHHAPGR